MRARYGCSVPSGSSVAASHMIEASSAASPCTWAAIASRWACASVRRRSIASRSVCVISFGAFAHHVDCMPRFQHPNSPAGMPSVYSTNQPVIDLGRSPDTVNRVILPASGTISPA